LVPVLLLPVLDFDLVVVCELLVVCELPLVCELPVVMLPLACVPSLPPCAPAVDVDGVEPLVVEQELLASWSTPDEFAEDGLAAECWSLRQTSVWPLGATDTTGSAEARLAVDASANAATTKTLRAQCVISSS
jgi:hypothetical protein